MERLSPCPLPYEGRGVLELRDAERGEATHGFSPLPLRQGERTKVRGWDK
jgi:hypothetical protein